MSEKLTTTPTEFADRADPANEASRNEAWGVDPKRFNDGNDYLANRPDTEVSELAEDMILAQHDRYSGVYGDYSLIDMAKLIRDANSHGDKGTSLEIQHEIEDRLNLFVESGQLTEEGAYNRLEQLIAMWADTEENTQEKSESTEPKIHVVLTEDDEKNEKPIVDFKDIYKNLSPEEQQRARDAAALDITEDDKGFYKKVLQAAYLNGFKPDEAIENTQSDAENNEQGATYNNLSAEEKLDFLNDVVGLVEGIHGSPEAYDKQLAKLKESLARDGGINDEEIDALVDAAQTILRDKKDSHEPVTNIDKDGTDKPTSPADTNDTTFIDTQSGKSKELVPIKRSQEAQNDEEKYYADNWAALSQAEKERAFRIAYHEATFDEINADGLSAIVGSEAAILMRRAYENGYETANLPAIVEEEETKERRRFSRLQKAMGAAALVLTSGALVWAANRMGVNPGDLKTGIADAWSNLFNGASKGEAARQAAEAAADRAADAPKPPKIPGISEQAEAFAEQLKSVPVRDGSGGYELVNTLGEALKVDIPTTVWDQHQYEFAAKFPEYTYMMPGNKVGLIDTSANSNISNYDLTRMKDLITSWGAR